MVDTRYTNARVRVTRYGAREALEAMEAHLGYLLDARGAVSDIDDARVKLNGRIAHTRKVIEELQRTNHEHGWSPGDQHDEPQRSHT